MTYSLRVEDVRRSYRGRQVLKSAGLWIRPGCITTLMGRNGCGKTTLVEIAVGWRRGDRGVVIVGNRRLTNPKLATLAQHGVFYLPQHSWLCPSQSVGVHFDAVRYHIKNAATDEAIDRLDLATMLDRLPHQLSGGQRRRVELGLAIARRPTCLLADEPFLGIAPQDADLICSILREFAESGCGVLVTGHEVPLLVELAQFVIWVSGGTTYDLGSTAEAVEHRQFVREYLGPRNEVVPPQTPWVHRNGEL